MCDFERIEALFDDTLPREEREEVRRHMETCPDCRRWYAALEELHTEVAAPDGFTARVMDEVRATPQEKGKTPRRWMPMAVAAACVMLVVGLGWWSEGQREDTPPAAVMSRGIESEPYSGTTVATYRCQTADGTVVDGALTEEQTKAVRSWLTAQARPADEMNAEGAPVYCLTKEETAALLAAVPGWEMPVAETQLTLPN